MQAKWLTQHGASASRWSTQLASALTYLHGRTPMVIFRDLSAANVLLTSTCSRGADVKLVDFGLAKMLPSQAECIQQGKGAPRCKQHMLSYSLPSKRLSMSSP